MSEIFNSIKFSDIAIFYVFALWFIYFILVVLPHQYDTENIFILTVRKDIKKGVLVVSVPFAVFFLGWTIAGYGSAEYCLNTVSKPKVVEMEDGNTLVLDLVRVINKEEYEKEMKKEFQKRRLECWKNCMKEHAKNPLKVLQDWMDHRDE